MVRGLYTSATGMLAQQKRMDVITNNIANADTTGFKKDGVVSRSFDEEVTRRINDKTQLEGASLSRKIGDMSLGTYVDEVYTDFSQSGFKQTNGNLDVALNGSGFFAINVTNKNGETTEKYTKDGCFTLGNEGKLMTLEGNIVLGENGPITLPLGTVNIEETGDIYVNGQRIDKLKIVDFENKETLKKFGDSLIETTEQTTPKDFLGSVSQGFLETSNVDSVKEMVNMITVMRAYEMNQKMVQIHDQTLSKAVNEIGK